MTNQQPSTPRTAVLSGAGSARGIGRHAAARLASTGWNVAVLDIDGPAATASAASIADETGTRTLGIQCDVSDPHSVDRAITAVEETLDPILGLVNLAGISSPTTFMETTLDEWEKVFAVNMRGTFLLTQRALRGMIERRSGRIVNLSSISAQRGGGTYSKVAYSASKGGIIGFSRALAREMGKHGITVNTVAPGPVDTDIMGGTLDAEGKIAMSEGTMLGRIASPDDVAGLIAFLLSDDATYITAATYDINGGLQIS